MTYNNHRVSIGLMNVECLNCHALKFKDEPNGVCCGNVKVKLPPLDNPTYN